MTNREDKMAQFFPFHAINDFMRPDYRLDVIRTVLIALPGLPENLRTPIEHMTRKAVKIPGFRNSAKAPVSMRVKPMAEAFEKNPNLVAMILAAWSEVHPKLRQQIYDLLITRSWDVLPADADRTKLPGFIKKWPKGEDFDALNSAYVEMYPDTKTNSDDISLMVVWISTRLPYNLDSDEEDQSEDQ